MEAVKVFLDANILFSASLGGASFLLLWELSDARKVTLCTSRYCHVEAFENLHRKNKKAAEKLDVLMRDVSIVPEAPEQMSWARTLLRERDVPVLAAAVGVRAQVLITGDMRDFGTLMVRKDLPLRVRTVRTFLLEWV